PRRTRRSSSATERSADRAVDGVAERAEDLDPRVVLVLGRDERPGGDLRARAVDHVADGALVGVPFLAVAPVLLGDLEALERRPLALLEAAELLLLAHLQPE